MITRIRQNINERSVPIPISPKKSTTTMEEIFSKKYELTLMDNFFYPSKLSPPNDFMLNLQKRLNEHAVSFK
jgi:hypothetical protein